VKIAIENQDYGTVLCPRDEILVLIFITTGARRRGPLFQYLSLFAMTHNYMTEAIQILDTVQDFVFPDRPEYLHPYTMLKALLTHAPAETAKQDIAKNIIESTVEGNIVTGLTNLTDYWWATLLVPRNSLYPLQYLLMKSADRRRKISTSFGLSIPPRRLPTAHDS
jgi:hypothetical protein